MRRGIKPFLALGAVAAVPVVILISSSRHQNEHLERVLAGGEPAQRPAASFLARAAELLSGAVPKLPGGLPAVELPEDAAHPSADEERAGFTRLPASSSPAQLARDRPADVARMRRAAEQASGGPLPPRISDAELMRFAVHQGYLRAASAAERERAVQGGGAAAADTARWLARHPFAGDEELLQHAHLVWWAAPGATEHPTLHVALGRASQECRGPAAAAFANVVMTHMERAVHETLRDGEGEAEAEDAAAAAAAARPERIDVVVDAAGATALSASRAAWVLTAVAPSLNRHYPGRLHELTLVNLPLVLTWLLRGTKRLVHPDTARKLRAVPAKHGAAAAAAEEHHGAGPPPL
jgi:hypothetical protein